MRFVLDVPVIVRKTRLEIGNYKLYVHYCMQFFVTIHQAYVLQCFNDENARGRGNPEMMLPIDSATPILLLLGNFALIRELSVKNIEI
jgi:hypothetical protein